MFKIYRDAVLAFYLQQVKNGSLSHLDQPSPSVLRDECLIANNERSLEDEIVSVRKFFGSENGDNKYYENKIESIDLERLKPLQRFTIGETVNPQNSVVEILAWLINFEHRPYHKGWTPPPSTGEEKMPETKTPKQTNQKLKFWQTPSFISGSIIAVCILCAYLIWHFNYNTSSSNPKSIQKCMYWTGNHFEPIDCNIPTNAIKEYLDIDRLHGFKKILVKDLLTKDDIGKVYVTGINEETEYFTQNGKYPGDSSKSLRPLSTYVLTKYSSFYRFLLQLAGVVLLIIFIVVAIVKIVYHFMANDKAEKIADIIQG